MRLCVVPSRRQVPGGEHRALIPERRAMTLGVRGRSAKALLLAVAPLATTLVVLGLSAAPASAWVVQPGCKGSGWTCVYANADYSPTSEVFNIQSRTHAWGSAPSNVCG